jgi:hypothetical protein
MTRPQSERVVFFVDGFNLYHSVLSAERQSQVPLKWLDLHALCAAHLYLIGPAAHVAQVQYFTAFAHHLHARNPGKVARHKAFVRALTASGVNVHEGHFKQKTVIDTWTAQEVTTHEEKETDVAIACAVLEAGVLDRLDTAVLVTGDTDLRPAVHSFHRLCPAKRLTFAFPFARENRELARVAPGSFSFSSAAYRKHQFPDKVELPSGKFVTRPSAWVGAPPSEVTP